MRNEKSPAASLFSAAHLKIKSNIAQDLFGYSESYQIFNELNEVVQKAATLYKDKSYQGYDLAD
jgi:hypothetical protein